MIYVELPSQALVKEKVNFEQSQEVNVDALSEDGTSDITLNDD